MAEILKSIQEEYVPTVKGNILKSLRMHGDAASEERARNVQWTYKLEETVCDQLKGLELTFGEFHMLMCLLEVSSKIFIKTDSGAQIGTSFASMLRTKSLDAKKGPKKAYNSVKDFHNCESEAHILSAWMTFSGMKSLDGKYLTVYHINPDTVKPF